MKQPHVIDIFILYQFQNDPSKIVEGAAFTRVDTICDERSDRQTDARGKTICIPTLTDGDIMTRKCHYYLITRKEQHVHIHARE